MKDLLKHVRADAVIERVSTKSILNPLLWLCAIILLTGIPAVCLLAGVPQVLLMLLIAFVVVVTIAAYFMWSFKDPDRLQSEDYQLARHKILQGTKHQDVITDSEYTTAYPDRQLTHEDSLLPDDSAYDEQPESGER